MVFKNLYVLVLRANIAIALEGLGLVFMAISTALSGG